MSKINNPASVLKTAAWAALADCVAFSSPVPEGFAAMSLQPAGPSDGRWAALAARATNPSAAEVVADAKRQVASLAAASRSAAAASVADARKRAARHRAAALKAAGLTEADVEPVIEPVEPLAKFDADPLGGRPRSYSIDIPVPRKWADLANAIG